MCLCILHGEGAETLQATLELGRLEFSKTHSVLCEQILLSFTKASRSRVVGRQDSRSLVRGQEVSGLERWQHEENDCRLHQWNNVTRRLRKEVGSPDSGRGCGGTAYIFGAFTILNCCGQVESSGFFAAGLIPHVGGEGPTVCCLTMCQCPPLYRLQTSDSCRIKVRKHCQSPEMCKPPCLCAFSGARWKTWTRASRTSRKSGSSSSHRVDLVAKNIEADEALAPVLRMLRRLCSHISNSSHAEGQLAAVKGAHVGPGFFRVNHPESYGK